MVNSASILLTVAAFGAVSVAALPTRVNTKAPANKPKAPAAAQPQTLEQLLAEHNKEDADLRKQQQGQETQWEKMWSQQQAQLDTVQQGEMDTWQKSQAANNRPKPKGPKGKTATTTTNNPKGTATSVSGRPSSTSAKGKNRHQPTTTTTNTGGKPTATTTSATGTQRKKGNGPKPTTTSTTGTQRNKGTQPTTTTTSKGNQPTQLQGKNGRPATQTHGGVRPTGTTVRNSRPSSTVSTSTGSTARPTPPAKKKVPTKKGPATPKQETASSIYADQRKEDDALRKQQKEMEMGLEKTFSTQQAQLDAQQEAEILAWYKGNGRKRELLELAERDFEDWADLEARDFDFEDLEARDFDELYARDSLYDELD